MTRFIPEYVESVVREIKLMSASSEEKLCVHTVYIGGGTPSLMEPSHIENILNVIRQEFNLINEAEVSMEANPGTVSRDKLLAFRKSGSTESVMACNPFNRMI